MRAVACPTGSDDYKKTKARRDYLAATHEERLREIADMHLSERESTRPHKTFNTNYRIRTKNVYAKREVGPYVLIWGKKVYIPEDKVAATMDCGMRVYLD